MKLPEGYQTVMPYLILQGTEIFLAFTKNVFHARELQVHRTPDGNVMHAEIQIGGSTIMMGESGNQWSVQNSGLYVNVEDVDTTYEKAIANGATTIMPVEDKPYGRTCGVKDPTGNTWWITTTKV